MLELSCCLGSSDDLPCQHMVDQNHSLLGHELAEHRKKNNSGSSRPLQGHPPTDGEIPIRRYLSESAQSPNSATLEPNFLTHRPLGSLPDPNDAILLVFLIIATFVSLSSLPVLICISPLRRDFECLVLIGIRVFFP